MEITGIQLAKKLALLTRKLRLNERIVYELIVRKILVDYQSSVAYLKQLNPFLITSTGRTGTTWLANLLNQIEDTYVVHEPVPQEQYHHVQALMYPETAMPYLRDFRLGEMALRSRTQNPVRYGEVNSALRRHVIALRQLMPEFTIIHLVRDGRDFVTSALNRPTLTPKDKIYGKIKPPSEDITPETWESMDRFTQLCWLWSYENEYLRKNSHELARFEDITSSFDLFKTQILEPLNLRLDESIWAEHSQKPVNATKGTKKADYSDWTEHQKQIFWEICGDEMNRYGYLK
ncbi:MAG TPA: sulfotransferase domain-containing protein [Oculatellaceae cyanobacterium]|jgi:hypothetical protein